MNADAGTSAWLKTELTSALGFTEVDDIVAYVLSSFQSKQEVAQYLTELLGITPARAETICIKLFAPPPPTSQQQSNKTNTKTKTKPNAKDKATGAAGLSGASAVGLVPPAAVPNSRLKQATKTGLPKLLHAQIINCLQCGKIEYNGSRKCLFCGTELRYEELDEHEIDLAAQRHMETLVLYDETSAERTTVIDTEEQLYEEVELRQGDDRRRPITLDVDLENRQFVVAGRDGATAAGRISRNQELSKDARDLCEGIQRRMEKESGRQQRKTGGGRTPADPSLEAADTNGVLVDEEYALVFV